MQPLRARWFDGRSSRPQGVLVTLHPGPRGPQLQIHRLDAPGSEPLKFSAAQVGWPESWSAARTPATVVVDLLQHGSLEIDDVAQWQAMRAEAGGKAPLAERMQTRWLVFLGVAVAAFVALGSFYRWGTPWAATQVTRQVPLEWETSLTERALADLDARMLKPSKLPAERQAAMQQRFEALTRGIDPAMRRYPAYQPKLKLLFRSGLPPNAFAMPGGTIVMTDALVEMADRKGLGDDALIGVLAHEIGHVLHRHTTRMVVEQGVLNIGLGLALGDVSALLSTGGSLLTGLAYRRGHESEADCFGAALMRKEKLPTGPMADLLLGMEASMGAKADQPQPKHGGPARETSAWMTLLSSHPDTGERARRLKEGHVDGC